MPRPCRIGFEKGRRQFLNQVAAFALGGVSAPQLVGDALARTRLRPSGRVLADLHTHPLLNAVNTHTSIGQSAPVLANYLNKSLNKTNVKWKESCEEGVDLLSVAHLNPLDEFVTMPADPSPDAARHLLAMMDDLEWELKFGEAAQYATIARSREDVERLTSVPKSSVDYRVAVVHSVEGGHAIRGCPTILPELASRGVFSIAISHFFTKGVASAPNAIPFFPDAGSADPAMGLSEFGRDLVRCMGRLGILVDVTHSSHTAVAEILRVAASDQPVIATHIGAESRSDHPYNLPDDLIVDIARRDGLISVPIFPYLMGNYRDPHLAEKVKFRAPLVATMRYLRNLLSRAGNLPSSRPAHEFLAFGSDFGGFIPAPGGIKGTHEFGEVRKALDEAFRDEPQEARDTMIDDILADNVLRFMKRHWHSHEGVRCEP